MRRVEGGEGALVGPGVGPAHRAHQAVAPGLDRDPLHGVIAVGRFLGKGVPLAAGTPAAADVVDDDGVAPTRVPVPLAGIANRVLEVGRALYERREPGVESTSVEGGQVDVGGQLHAVAGRDEDVGQHDGIVGAVRALERGVGHASIHWVRDQAVTS